MQTTITETDYLSQIELALDSNDVGHAATLMTAYLSKETADDSDRFLNLRLRILINQGRFEELDKLVYEVATEEPSTKARLYVAKGILANRKGDYQVSLTRFLEAESLDVPDDLLKAQIQINIGTVYASLHHYDEGLERYQGALNRYGKVLSPRTKAALLHNLGNLHYANHNIEESIVDLSDSLAISKDIQNHRLEILSTVLLARSKTKYEGHCALEDLDIDEGDDIYPVYQYCKYRSKGEDSVEDLRKIINVAGEAKDFVTQVESLNVLIELQKNKGDFANAFQSLERLRKVENELLQIQEDARLIEQTVKFQIAEKEQAIKTYEKEKALQDEIVKRNDMLEVANEDLRQFAYVVSHDLKEPLRMIGAYTQLIELETKGKSTGEVLEYFDFVRGGVDRLNVLLDGLSNYSTLKSLQETQEELTLSTVVGEALENLDFLIQESGAVVEVAQDGAIKGSKALLVLLFQNLIQNAIKFKNADRDPIIQIQHGKMDKGIFIDVKDNGIGIAEDQKDRIFIIFQRLSRSNNTGSGMGLAISKKIVQLHEGNIFVKSSDDTGATFRIELPY